VLLIDDEKNILSTLTVCLEGIGCVVTAVASGTAALQVAARQPFDLAFVDLRLRDLSGLDLLPHRSGLPAKLNDDFGRPKALGIADLALVALARAGIAMPDHHLADLVGR
jgi:CheY-like chemotaxis protein